MLRPHPSLPHPWAERVDPDADELPCWSSDPAPPVIWSVAGNDSGGGAGLSADARAAAALGVHLCPVVAVVTAQNSLGLQALQVQDEPILAAQMRALADDLRPRVVKTGLLASPAAVRAVARQVDRLREDGPVLLVVDPVLGASAGGVGFDNEALRRAYVEELLPRCDLLTPNRGEAERLGGAGARHLSAPALAARLRAAGARAVCLTGGDERPAGAGAGLALDWLDSGAQADVPPVQGWLALPLHHHGSGCTFASAAAAALARGFALPDAIILAKMLTWCALRDGHAAGQGAGPLRPAPGFMADPQAMPVLGWQHENAPDDATLARWSAVLRNERRAAAPDFAPGLYGISADPAELAALARDGHFAHLQLRVKPEQGAVTELVGQALAHCEGPARLWINDHAEAALALGAQALHLGQDDWAGLAPLLRERILHGAQRSAPGLGVSSHSLWELARARGLAPDYIACGPIWPTTTKHMPWLPQGLAQLRWWRAMAGVPVVAIGGITDAGRLARVRRSGSQAAALVRGLQSLPLEREAGRWRAMAANPEAFDE